MQQHDEPAEVMARTYAQEHGDSQTAKDFLAGFRAAEALLAADLAAARERIRELGAAFNQAAQEAEKRRDEVAAAREREAEHALANSGCVPRPAYDDLATECRAAAWETLTRITADHRYCDCTGSYPCDVRRVVDRFGKEFTPAALAGEGAADQPQFLCTHAGGPHHQLGAADQPTGEPQGEAVDLAAALWASVQAAKERREAAQRVQADQPQCGQVYDADGDPTVWIDR